MSMDFTVEETNLINIYKTDTLADTLEWIDAMLSYMDDEMRLITQSASRKLAAVTEPEFAALSFTPADETDGG